MTSPIRPGFTPVPIPQPSAARADARAAQRAFFQQALGEARASIDPQGQAAIQTQAAARAQPAAAPEAVKPVQAAAAPAPTTRAEAAGQPQRLLRPGSLLDIRV